MGTSDALPLAPITIPQMGVVEDVIVVEWLAANGDPVVAGEPVVAVDTDKAVTELEAPASGTLRIGIAAGDAEVPVGTVIGHVVVG